jgi:probable O-glycosylation ligase (exosortase A-associated)
VLRAIFVVGIITIGAAYAVRQPFYSLLLYLWFGYFRPELWIWDDFISGLNLSFILGLWTVVAAALSPRVRFRFNVRIALLALFVLQALLSTAASSHFDYSWTWLREFLKWVLMTYLIVVLTTDVPRFRLLLVIIALSLGFEAAKQGWASLVLNPGGHNDNYHPMLGDNNGVAVGMLMLVPVLTALASTAGSRWEKQFERFLAIGVVNRAITTYSRGGFLAALALALAYVLRSTKRVPAIAGIVVAVAIIVPVLPDAFWDRMNTIRSPDEISKQNGGRIDEMREEDVSSLGRLHYWNVALRMANDRPLLGVGYNAFNVSYDEYDDLHGAMGTQRSAHSAWLGLLAELGYPGLLLFLAQLALAFQACRRARRAAKLGPEHANLRQFAFALESGLIVFAVGGTFLPYQYTEMLWHWFGLTIALDGLARAALASSMVSAQSPSSAVASGAAPIEAFVS